MASWAGLYVPQLWQDAKGEHIDIDVPDYGLRTIIAARDPAAVVANFRFSVQHILARLAGLKMCSECPQCNSPRSNTPCSNHFGHNMTSMGGFAGLGVALGGCVEYQQKDNPHFHGNLHLASMYQFKTLAEIAELMESNLVTLDEITHYQDWICHEDPLDMSAYDAVLLKREQQWSEDNSDKACHTLCCYPSYLRQPISESLWSTNSPCTHDTALTEGEAWRQTYFEDAEQVFSYCHHHWHPKCPRTGQRQPIRHCRVKGCSSTCKAGFPMDKRLVSKPKIVCPGNARKHGLRVAGRRNALGSVLSRRRCPWRSGGARAMAVFLRHNTHTGPNYRVPLMKEALSRLQRRLSPKAFASENGQGSSTSTAQHHWLLHRIHSEASACREVRVASSIHEFTFLSQGHTASVE